MRLKAHPRYAVYKAWFGREAGRSTKLQAELYRVAGPRHTTPSEIVAGVGAFRGGGRWNPPGVMHVVYLSFSPETALHEANEHGRYYRIPLSKEMPKVIVAVGIAVEAVLDLTRGASPEPMANLMAEDSRAMMARKEESATQAVGRAAFAAGLQGLVVPSKPHPGGANVLIFPQNLTVSSAMGVLNPELLKKLGRSP